jgi:SHS2 domain-containing protein
VADVEASSYEILEHTADIGLQIRAASLEALFAAATWGMVEIVGAGAPHGSGTFVEVNLDAADVGGLLVDWLNEVLFLIDSRAGYVADVLVDRASESWVAGRLGIIDGAGAPEGTELKAATYHRLSVARDGDGWAATVFFDV